MRDIEQRAELRSQAADAYDERTGNQQKWYSRKATANKKGFQWIGVAIVIIGAIVGVTPIFTTVVLGIGNGPNETDLITSLLGTAIVILKGIERIWLPEETWQNYRKASEALKRERECYIEGVAHYGTVDSEDKAYTFYVARCILIKAEEQNNFWGLSESQGKGGNQEQNEGTVNGTSQPSQNSRDETTDFDESRSTP